MANFTRRCEFRVDEEGFQKLVVKAKEEKYNNLSEFFRDSLLENNGLRSAAIKKQMRDLRWEINKIGTNINQTTKRINSGTGTAADVADILTYQDRLISLMEKYLLEVEDLWQ